MKTVNHEGNPQVIANYNSNLLVYKSEANSGENQYQLPDRVGDSLLNQPYQSEDKK